LMANSAAVASASCTVGPALPPVADPSSSASATTLISAWPTSDPLAPVSGRQTVAASGVAEHLVALPVMTPLAPRDDHSPANAADPTPAGTSVTESVTQAIDGYFAQLPPEAVATPAAADATEPNPTDDAATDLFYENLDQDAELQLTEV
jgi:hypothetical protein